MAEKDSVGVQAPELTDSQRRGRGMLIMFFGVMAISPDAMFVRLMQAEAGSVGMAAADADLQITFWKYLLILPLHLAVTTWHAGGSLGGLLRKVRAGPGHIIAGGVCQACISIALNLAYTNTIAARAHVFFALSPFWAAMFSWLCLHDVLPARTLVAVLLAGVSILIIFLPKLVPALDNGGDAAAAATVLSANTSSLLVETPAPTAVTVATVEVEVATLHGDMLGMLAGAALGALIVVSASAKRRCPDATMLASILVGSSIVVSVSLVWQACAMRPSMGTISWQFGALALADGLCICIVYVATVIAPRYASSAEVSLLNPLEALFGPLFVYLGVGEVPSHWTLLGGAVLLLSLFGHEVWGYVEHSRAAVVAPARSPTRKP